MTRQFHIGDSKTVLETTELSAAVPRPPLQGSLHLLALSEMRNSESRRRRRLSARTRLKPLTQSVRSVLSEIPSRWFIGDALNFHLFLSDTHTRAHTDKNPFVCFHHLCRSSSLLLFPPCDCLRLVSPTAWRPACCPAALPMNYDVLDHY